MQRLMQIANSARDQSAHAFSCSYRTIDITQKSPHFGEWTSMRNKRCIPPRDCMVK